VDSRGVCGKGADHASGCSFSQRSYYIYWILEFKSAMYGAWNRREREFTQAAESNGTQKPWIRKHRFAAAQVQ
jgi:hypothetical protein